MKKKPKKRAPDVPNGSKTSPLAAQPSPPAPASAGAQPEPAELRELVLGLLKSLKPPTHVGVLSIAYKNKTGRAIKNDYKGGMLRFLKTELAQSVVLMGDGNDTFARVATPTGRASHWIKECVRVNGPILASMVGRLYHEATGNAFNAVLPDAGGIIKFMRTQLADDLSFEAQKGQEVLVDMKQRSEGPRAFLAPESKKQRKEERKAAKRKRAEEDGSAGGDDAGQGASVDSATAAEGAAAATAAPGGGRVGERGIANAYSVPSERLLLLGEADFSFAAALCAHPHLPEGSSLRRRRLTATSFDDLQTLRTKYGEGLVERHLKRINKAGAMALHGIDATRLAEAAAQLDARGPFDTICMLFPHAGSASGLHNSIDENRALLHGLLLEAPTVLAPGGEVHVTLVHRFPYTAWLTGLTGQGASAASTRGGPSQASVSEAGVASGTDDATQPAKKKKKGKKTEQAAADSSSPRAEGSGASKRGDASTALSLPTGMRYLGACPFDFGAFSGYQHRATSKVEGGSAGALEVGTRCLTHVWRLVAEPSATAGTPGDDSLEVTTTTSTSSSTKKRPNNKKRSKRAAKLTGTGDSSDEESD